MSFFRYVRAVFFLCRLQNPCFAVPFSITVPMLCADNPLSVERVLYLFGAAICAFTAGSAVNSFVDRKFDVLNPRTATRPMAQGELPNVVCFIIVGVLLAASLYCTWKLGVVFLMLWPIPAVLMIVYSFLKRYTWFCHFMLASVNAMVPVGSWLVFRGWFDWRMLIAGALVFFWTIGFELLYSCQDAEFDAGIKLNSIPSRFGVPFAFNFSLVCLLLASLCQLALMYIMNVGPKFWIGGSLALVVMLSQQVIARKFGRRSLPLCFNLNQVYSVIMALTAVLSRVTEG